MEVYIAHKTEYEKSSGSNIVYKSWGKESDRSYRYDGNELRDFASDDPVNIIDPRFREEPITTHPEWEKGFHMIPYSSIGGDGVMKVFRIEKMCIHMDEDIWIRICFSG